MAEADLEKRVVALEAELARLREIIEKPPEPEASWVDKVSGIFANDPLFEEAMRSGREYRESTRPKPRHRRKV